MQKKIFRIVVFIFTVSFVIVPSSLADSDMPPNFDPNRNVGFTATINGKTFTITKDLKSHQLVKSTDIGDSNSYRVPLRLGAFDGPIKLQLKSTDDISTSVPEFRVEPCNSVAQHDSKYYLDPGTLNVIKRTQNDMTPIYVPIQKDYSLPRTKLNTVINDPNCYQITYKNSEITIGDTVAKYNTLENIYFTASIKNYLKPDFSISFNNSDINVFNGAVASVFLPSEMVTVQDTTVAVGDAAVVSRQWGVSWSSSVASAILPIPSSFNKQASFSYNLGNPGHYRISLIVTDANGITYSVEKDIFGHKAKDYFGNVVMQRDGAKKDFSAFLNKVSAISDVNVKGLYTAALDGCKLKTTTLGGTSGTSLDCSDAVLQKFKAYDDQLKAYDVPCSAFPDLNNISAFKTLCRGAEVVKDADAFQGDGAGSANPGYLRPNDKINRAETCAIMNKSQISTQGTHVPSSVSTSGYSDLVNYADTDWVKTNASACKQFGGYPDGTFKPANNINMAEILKVLFGLFNVNVDASYANELPKFCPGISSDQWYSKYMGLAFNKGFMDEISSNCDPSKEVTRSDVVITMYKMFFEYAYIPEP